MTIQDYEAALRGITADLVSSFAHYQELAKDGNAIPSEERYVMYQYLSKQYDLIEHVCEEAVEGVYHDHNAVYDRHIARNNDVQWNDVGAQSPEYPRHELFAGDVR